MTVQRCDEEIFACGIDEVSGRVRAILKVNPVYKQTSERSGGRTFATVVKPGWWLLGTAMTIALQERGSDTVVTVSTKSQPWIFGDVFSYYDRYIRDFIGSLKEDQQH